MSREQDRLNAESFHYNVLIGCKITGTVQSEGGDAVSYDTMIGLTCEKGTGRNREEFVAWIQSDPEGNGRGHLEIEKQ